MSIAEIAPVVRNHDIIDIRVRKPIVEIIIRAIEPAYINSVVILRFLLFLPSFE